MVRLVKDRQQLKGNVTQWLKDDYNYE